MQNINAVLTAGVPTQFQVKGKVLQIVSSGQSAGLTVQFLQGNQIAYTVNGALSGWKLTPQGGFDSITLASATAGTVAALVTNGDIDVQILENASAITNTPANPVPVSLVSEPGAPVEVTITGANTIEVTATNVGINNTVDNPVPVTPTQAASVVEVAPVVVGAAVGALIAAAARRALRVRNAGTGLLAIGGNAALTLAQAVIVLNPGDVWEETLAPSAAWYAVSDTGTTAAVETVA
jgi:hypothetical protein